MVKKWTALGLALALLVTTTTSCGLIEPADPTAGLSDDVLSGSGDEGRNYLSVGDFIGEDYGSAPDWSTEPVLSEEQMPDDYNGLELPIEGATGYATIRLTLFDTVENARAGRSGSRAVKEGTPFTILGEEGDWWEIQCSADYLDSGSGSGEVTGWVQHRYCMINLPDVIPSIFYNATNAYSSQFRSSGKELRGITGERLYFASGANERMGWDDYAIMPVLYSMSFKLCQAQRAALAEGNTLVLVEGFRPWPEQKLVSDKLSEMMREDSEVREGVTKSPWSISWFIATSPSNHQFGYAVDAALARVYSVEECETGGYRYIRMDQCALYTTPTAFHELSYRAATFTRPVPPNDRSAWKSATLTETMKTNEPAMALQDYFVGAGMTPLASEWWHFNDLDSRSRVSGNLSTGEFGINVCRSVAPSGGA